MSWKPANPLLFLVLVFLLAGDFGLHIFADANYIECNDSWEPAGVLNNNKMHKCGLKDSKGVTSAYWCESCNRSDNKKPNAVDCVGPQKLSTRGAFTCDAGMHYSSIGHPDRPILCIHFYPAGHPEVYTCASRQVNQRCTSEYCKLVT
ncbi:uncharacterized protein MELLADRAFT_123860 [Melampsora larici-populina 98AG31]|uniref:Secreted protein n=1 Tax=Melampsora larici-populina (strain 98AG31 / pathotype 3-4-7) TaxID=747676 RepID=F4REN1_MELLP|nr:uncharacterized protein MELLADRAFT_123860 [Melampsora larici-populina 98AG31]EGG09250.1 secreted protein [Melampsora larici-populina 98AG31]